MKYQIQISDNSSFSPALIDYTEESGSTGPRNNVTYTPSSLDDGSYYWRVKAFDNSSAESGWATANSGSIAFKIDTQSPIISSVITNPGSNTAEINWDTNEDATSVVNYGLSTNYGNNESDETLTSSPHSLTLTDLNTCTLYHYQISSGDPAGNEDVESDRTLTTSGCTGSASIINHTESNLILKNVGGTLSLR